MAFYCQNCKAPIALDTSLRNISKAQTKFLLSKTGKPPALAPLAPARYIPHDRLALAAEVLQNESGNALVQHDYSSFKSESYDSQKSYVFLSDTEDGDNAPFDHERSPDSDTRTEQLPDFSKINSLNQVFQILSTNENVDHPMCAECSHLLTSNYKLKFDQSQREKELYVGFLRKLKESDGFGTETALDQKLTESHSEYVELRLLEHDKLAELQGLEETYDELVAQLKELEVTLDHLNSHELNEIIRLKNSLSMELLVKQNKLDQTKALYQKHLNHLDQLRSLNIFTRLFDILFPKEDNYGRINGYRLGYRVPWPEINVALGQVVLLLVFLQRRLLLTLELYKLVPMGSKSYIVKKSTSATESGERTKTTSVLQLYSSNEFTLGKLFNFNKVDVSMMALLDVLSQVESKLVSLDEDLQLPYQIGPKHDTIGGKSIRVTSNGQWTESCRYLLIDLNWMLTYVSTMS